MKPATEVPDGGWGWAVVSGTAIINIFNQSLLSMFGLVFGSTLEAIAGTTGVTTVMSLNVTVSNFSGLLISPLSKYFTTKQITQIGVLLVAAGLAMSTYTQNYTRVTFGYGVLTGLGLGLIASSTFLIINSYFNKNKSQAVGLSMAGTSVGQMAMPPVVAHLIQHYSYDGTILILSAMSLHGLIGSMFFDPVSEHMLPRNRPKTKRFFSQFRDRISSRRNGNTVVIENNLPLNGNHVEVQNKGANNNIDRETCLIITDVENRDSVICNEYQVDENAIDIVNDKQSTNGVEDVISNNSPAEDTNNLQHASVAENTKLEEEEKILESNTLLRNPESKKPSSCWNKVVVFFGLHILMDAIFVHIMVGLSFAYTTSIAFSTFFPLFLTEDLDMTIIDASTCMAVLSFVDFIGRIIVPIITKQLNVTHRTIFIIGSFFLAISRSLLVLQTTFTMLIVFSAIIGLARAATVINQNLVIAEYSKEAHVSSAVGLNMVCKGVFVLTIGRLLGMYKDSAHNFAGCIHIINIISMGVVVSWTTELIIRWTCRRKNTTR